VLSVQVARPEGWALASFNLRVPVGLLPLIHVDIRATEPSLKVLAPS